MGELLKTFTYPRNAFGGDPQRSGEKALEVIERVERNDLLRDAKGAFKDEAFNDARLFLATVIGQPASPTVTSVGEAYKQLAAVSPVSAWRWLLTRSMWLYSVPNGSNVEVNKTANLLGVRFNFFDMVTRLSVHFSALPEPRNIIYFDEFLVVLNEDQNWTVPAEALFHKVLDARAQLGIDRHEDHAELLSELEPQYGISRDYLNTVFVKAFGQCGLFTITGEGRRRLGIKLDPGTYDNPVLAERLRFVLDHPRTYEP